MALEPVPRLAGVVLAAGYSRRAGVFKPGFVHEGKALLLHAIDGLEPWCTSLLVVAGERREDVEALAAMRPGTRTVTNPRPQDGMFSSVQAGAAEMGRELEGFFVLPVDCPLVKVGTYAILVSTFAAHEGRLAVVPGFDGHGGHPVLLPASARDVVLAAPLTMTLRDLLRDLRATRVPVTDPAVLMDLDTADDLLTLSTEGET
jgi:molybdenum cofactor cytidylyltransferase